MKKSSIQLTEMLYALDTRDKSFYEKLTDEQKKEFSPWLCMRYASSCKGQYSNYYLIMVNSFVNNEFNTLTKHPNLQWKLLSLCGVGIKQYHPWIPPPKRQAKSKLYEELSKLFPLYNDDELSLVLKKNGKAELIEMFESHGYDDKEIKDIFKNEK